MSSNPHRQDPAPRIVSGVQPTGNLHLGNYLGALKQFANLQDLAPTFLFVADLHALTMRQDPALLASQTRSIAAAYLAAGLDPHKAVIFPQSAVRAHSELAWLLSCVARIGWMDRMVQYKEKSGKDKEGASVGLFTYPVLQAADILIYRATGVPVGKDQHQHLELARKIASRFNAESGMVGFFPLPQPVTVDETARVMSLRDGSKKMSKSEPVDHSRINLTDDADLIRDKVRRAKTDSAAIPTTTAGLAGRPEAENLIGIFSVLSGVSRQEALNRFGGQGFGPFKEALVDVMVEALRPLRNGILQYQADPAELDRVLADGAHRARQVAEPVVEEARRAVGLWPAP